jgi:serine protease
VTRSSSSRAAALGALFLGVAIALPVSGAGASATPGSSRARAIAHASQVPGEVVVGYRNGTTARGRRAARRRAGVRAVGAIGGASQVVRAGHQATAAAAARLSADPHVRYALPNYIARASSFVPNDPGRGQGWPAVQWNFLDPFGIRVLGAWQNAIDSGHPGGAGVLVAVLDTGVAYRTSRNHRFVKAPDLERKRFVRGHDFIRGNRLPYDRNGHGTFIAGTIAQSTNNGIGVTGVAYQARIMPVRVLDFEGKGDVATIASGIRFAARHGAKIINMSFEFDIGLTASQIPDVISAIRFAYRHGVLLVAAAGNAEDTRVAYPALAKHVLAVGATTEHGCLADYSNTGYGLDFVAPGGGADAAVEGDPNCRGFESVGRDIYQYTFSGLSFGHFGLPSGYEGTSMAVPHVSGTAALLIGEGLLGRHPTPDAIIARLVQTARDLGRPGYDSVYGFGLLDAAAATAR